MRITIWQEFASNHSAHFQIVGQFESPAWAADVAEELRHILDEIAAWWDGIDNYTIHDPKQRELAQRGELTPPERQFSLEYGVPWWGANIPGEGRPLDWVRGRWAAASVVVYDKLVFMEPRANTWAGPVPFDAIMRALGGEVAAEREDGGRILTTLSCTAPDEDIARQLVDSVKLFTQRSGETGVIIKIPGVKPSLQGEGQVIREGNHVIYKSLDWYYQDYRQGDQRLNFLGVIMAFVEYLKRQGCTEISYHFEQVED